MLGLALGYEDLNDHDVLRRDPVSAAVSRQADTLGERRSGDDAGCALAGKRSLNRLEGSARPGARGRYKKIVPMQSAMDALLLTLFIESFTEEPVSLTLDIDATDAPLHGHQEGRFFHGYYDNYCYLPLYIFCGEQLLCARLRTADQDGAGGTQIELACIVQRLLFADRTSCTAMSSNQLRLYFSSFAYCLMQALRRLACAGTSLAKAQCGTLREKLLKDGARVRVSVRKLWVSLPTAYLYAGVFMQAYHQLQRIPLRI